ncbi:MAG: alpha/beta fold hydrolase [bacterium]
MTHKDITRAYKAIDPTGTEKIVPIDPVQQIVEIAGIEHSYLIWGDISKPAVILVHGGKDHARNWDWTVAGLIEDYCCITPDLRGHGDTGRAPGAAYDWLHLVSDFAALMEHLRNQNLVKPFALIGHSLGGNIVLHQAALYPEDIVKVVSMEGLGPSIKWHDEAMAVPIADRMRRWIGNRLIVDRKKQKRSRTADALVARMQSVHKNLTPDQARHLALHAARHYKNGWGWKHDPVIAFAPEVRMTAPAEYMSLFSEITCPVLLMRGEDSWASDPVADGRIKAFQNARLVTYAQAGHWMHHDQFDLFLRDIRAFLKDR